MVLVHYCPLVLCNEFNKVHVVFIEDEGAKVGLGKIESEHIKTLLKWNND